ncbi:MAG: transposase [Thermaurantimonas sp.]|uniref:transposase n=1 Tax=Thermaurantimonas sp. TaxID=2681568 RepID=UPI00391966F7
MATDSKGYTKRIYRSDNSKCKDCPLRQTCIGKSDFKKIEDSIDKPYYDRMHEKLSKKKEYAQKLSRIRSKTVEPVLGTLLNYLNLRRVNTRGMAGANKHVLLSAMSYNLKKYLKFIQRKAQIKVQAMPKPEIRWNTTETLLQYPKMTSIVSF